MDSRQSTVGGWPIAVAVQRPTMYTHVYWCVCVPRRGRGTQSVLSLAHVPQADVFRAVVVSVDLISAVQTLELLTITIILVCDVISESPQIDQ